MKLLKEQWDFVATNVMIEFYLCHYPNALELMVEILQGKVLIDHQLLGIQEYEFDKNHKSYSTASFFDGRGKEASEMQLSRTTSERQNLGKLKFLKLYDMEADPNEIKDVSEDNPNVVNQLLIKLADYYDEQVTPWFPAEENESNPNNFDGVWKAWHM